MSIEQTINYQLNKFPTIKKVVKRVYQSSIYAISPKIKSEGNIIKVSPDDDAEYFFGYYDKSPWDASGRYMLCMKTEDTWSEVSPLVPVDLLLIDTQNNNSVRKLGESHSWNVQQGCMLQWLGPDFDKYVIYNDFRGGCFCSVILNIESGKERVVDCPIYAVSSDGITALSLDFTRLHRLRKGYGYANMDEITKDERLPDTTCIWKIDLGSGGITPLLKYTDFASFEPRNEMIDAEHKVNHLMISPNGKRFMVLHRWLKGHRKYTRLVTCNIDGHDMYNLSDDDMVSHCYWKNDDEILAFENKHHSGPGYYLMRDKTKEYKHVWPELCADGHPSYSPNGSLVVTDSYPDRARIASIRILSGVDVKVVARVFAPFKYDNDTRCDLHPRWSRDGKMICFDSVFEGHRGLYIVKL